jgi:hypothetical protein
LSAAFVKRGALYLPRGADFDLPNAGEKALFVDDDGLLKLQLPDGTSEGLVPGGQASGVWYTEVIDLVTTGTYNLVPPMGYRFDRGLTAWQIVSTGGTIATSPTYSVGSNASSYNDYLAAQTSAGFTTQAANTFISPGSFATPAPAKDISASGLKVVISIGATGTSPVLTGRFRIVGSLIPL